jgi:hypothetical protein
MVTCIAHVHGGRATLGDLAPSKLRWVSFSKTEHPKHISNPSRYTLHDFDVQFVCARIDIHVSAGDQVPQDVNRTGSIKGIAKRFSEPILGSIQSFLRGCDKNKFRIHKILRTHLSRHVQDHGTGGSHLEQFAQTELD